MTFTAKNPPLNAVSWDEKEQLYKIIQLQNEQLEEIHSSIDDIIWIAKFNPFEILYINKACEKVLGYTMDELITDSSIFVNNVHPDDIPIFYQAIETAFKDGSASCEYRIKHKDGCYRTLRSQGSVKKDRMSEPDVLSGISTDITNLRDTENALREKVNEVETILESISDAFCAIDENWNFTYVNKAFDKLFNVNGDSIKNTSFWDCFPNIKTSFFYTGMTTAIEKKKPVHMEGLSPSIGKTLSATFYPFKNGLAMYAIDITDKEVQKQTIEEQEQLLTDIAQLQSHQVRGPVATILGLAQLLNAEDPTAAINKEVITGLVSATQELDKVIKQINTCTKKNGTIAA